MPALDLTQASLSVSLGFNLPASNPLVQQPNSPNYPANGKIKFTIGSTGALNLNKAHTKQYTIGAGATETIDLNAVADLNGDTINFSSVRLIFVEHDPTSQASSVKVNGGAANVTSDLTATLNNSDMTLITRQQGTTGITVTNTTADKLVIVNNDGGNSAKVNVHVWGIGT